MVTITLQNEFQTKLKFTERVVSWTGLSKIRTVSPKIKTERPSPIERIANGLYFRYAFIANLESAVKPFILLGQR